MYRGYESPLDYFLDHKNLIDKSRFELSLIDPGLYRSLLRWEQIDEAIPDVEEWRVEAGRKGGEVTYSMNGKILESILLEYVLCDRNATLAAKKLSYSKQTIREIWKENGLETIGKGNSRKKF
jgi:hypothetical protein